MRKYIIISLFIIGSILTNLSIDYANKWKFDTITGTAGFTLLFFGMVFAVIWYGP